ncbi:MAG TPA: hypothetical protein VMI73_09145 [Trebonia sp.]|nr:hypothetical protein [Trebonia sp.]
MLTPMYLWTLVGHDTAEGTVRAGIGGCLPDVMRTLEPMLLTHRAFLGRIVEVVPRLSVAGLQEVYVPTGREWSGRRDNRGGVHWAQALRPVDPEAAYSLHAGQDVTAEPEARPGARR